MCVLSFNCKIRPFTLACESSILTRLRIMNFIMVNSADANMKLVCTSKNVWAELSYKIGPSCLINLGRVGMGRVFCGPSWHAPSWFWAELSVIQINNLAVL